MDAERWSRIEAMFHEALDLPEDERSEFLDRACGDDAGLRGELVILLGHADPGGASIQEAVRTEVRLLASDAVSSHVGRRIGPFRLTQLVGEGGMGAVYLAERDDAQFSQRVAIKILPHALGASDAIARFRDERQILAGLEHPNIVRLLDGGNTDGNLPYLVMEYIEGEVLHRYAEHHQLSVRARVELVRQVCGALQYAHQNLVVHRDIKPSNILVDATGVPKILDFGIAKLLSPARSFQREARTRTGYAMFTPEYASPEQARGDAVSTATDVYSVGAVLYELVAGQPAHRAASGLDMLRVICEVDPARPSAVAPDARRRELAGDLDNIIMKALHKELARRYASMEQLADDLGRWLDGLPVAARTPTVGYRARMFARRNKAMVAAATLVATTLIGATFVSLRQAQRADEQAARAEVERANAVEAANRARSESDRARKAETQLQQQLDALRAEQTRRAAAEAQARASGDEAEQRRREAETAAAAAQRGQKIAEQESVKAHVAEELANQESAKARTAEDRAKQAAEAETEARKRAQALAEKERERADRAEQASKKITTDLR